MSVPAPRPLPLRELHDRLAAAWTATAGWQTPARYGQTAEEYRSLRESCGFVDRSWIGRLELLGEDRQRFLHGLVTCDVTGLQPGQGAYGFFTSIHGKVLFDVAVLALPDRLWLELPPGSAAAVEDHLRKYLIADRVEIRPLEDLLPLALVGPGAEVLVAEALPAGPAWTHRRAMIAGIEAHVVRLGRCGVPAVGLWAPSSLAPAFSQDLLGLTGVGPVGLDAMEIVRVESGLGRFGVDYSSEHFPQETGAEEEAVSYTKGCYLGQEIVARIHYRGGVQRSLRGLLFEDDAPPPLGTALHAAGGEVGRVTSAVHSPALGRPIGLAVLHRKAGEPGASVDLAGGGRAEIAALPFVG